MGSPPLELWVSHGCAGCYGLGGCPLALPFVPGQCGDWLPGLFFGKSAALQACNSAALPLCRAEMTFRFR
eukprot:5411203-Prymnesium_polylepis.2